MELKELKPGKYYYTKEKNNISGGVKKERWWRIIGYKDNGCAVAECIEKWEDDPLSYDSRYDIYSLDPCYNGLDWVGIGEDEFLNIKKELIEQLYG